MASTNDAQQASNNGIDVSQLSYLDFAVDSTGAVMSRDDKVQLRVKHGYCVTCDEDPVQLYEIKRSRFNPLWTSKRPLMTGLDCANGVCLKCATAKRNETMISRSTAAAAAHRASSARTWGSVSAGISLNQNHVYRLHPNTNHSANNLHATGGLLDPEESGWYPVSNSNNNNPPLHHHSRVMSPSVGSSHSSSTVVTPRSSPSAIENPSSSHSRGSGEPEQLPHHHQQQPQQSSHQRRPIPRTVTRSRSSTRSTLRPLTASENNTARMANNNNSSEGNGNGTNSHARQRVTSIRDMVAASAQRTAPSNPTNSGTTNNTASTSASTSAAPGGTLPKPTASSVRTVTRDIVRQPSNMSMISNLSEPVSERQVSDDHNSYMAMMMEREASTRSFETLPESIAMTEGTAAFTEESFSNLAHSSANSAFTCLSPEEAQMAKPSTLSAQQPNTTMAVALSHSQDNAEEEVGQDEESHSSQSQAKSEKKKQFVRDLQVFVDDLVSSGSPQVLADVLASSMKADSSNEFLQAYCMSCFVKHFFGGHGSFGDEKQCAQLLLEAGAHKMMLQAMKKHQKSTAVQEAACQLLVDLANAPEPAANRSILVQAGFCRRIQKALAEHVDVNTIVQPAFAAIRSLSVDSEARVLFRNAGLGNQIVHAMQCLSLEREIQRDGCAILSNLAVDFEKKQVSPVDQDIFECVLQAIRNHSTDPSVVESASFSLKNFTYDDDNLSTLSRIPTVNQILSRVQNDSCCCQEAMVVVERVQIRQAEDRSMEEQALEGLRCHIQLKQGDPKLVLDIVDVMDMHSWSQQILLTCLQELSQLISSVQEYKDLLRADDTALKRIRGHVAAFGSDVEILNAANSVLSLAYDSKEGGRCMNVVTP